MTQKQKDEAYRKSIEKDYGAITAGQPEAATIPDVIYPTSSTPFVNAKAGKTSSDVTTSDTFTPNVSGTERHNVVVPPDYVPKVEGLDVPQSPAPVNDGTPDVSEGDTRVVPTKAPKVAPTKPVDKEIDTPLGSTYTKPWKPADIRFDGNILRRILQTAESGMRGYTGDKTETDRQRELREIASFKEISDRAASEAKARATEYAEQEKSRREGFAHERSMQKSELEGRKAIEEAQRRAAAGASGGIMMNPKMTAKRQLPNGVIVDVGMMAD